jgi:hypothetical protein
MPPNWFEKWIKVHGVDVKATPVLAPDVTDFTEVSFKHPALWQSDEFFTGADTTQIKVPNKLAGRYFLRATIRWERADFNEFQIADRDGSCFLSYLTKNGDSMADHLEDSHLSAAPIVRATKAVTNTLWEGNLVKDDFIKLFVKHDGTIIDDHDKPLSIMINVWLTLRRLGPRTL